MHCILTVLRLLVATPLAVLGVLAGVGLTVTYSLIVVAVYSWLLPLYRKQNNLCGIQRVERASAYFSNLIEYVCLRGIMFMRVKTDGLDEIRPAEQGEIVIMTTNHPSLMTMLTAGVPVLTITRHGTAVAKDAFSRSPWLAWLGRAAAFTGNFIFVDRENTEEGKRMLRKALHTLRLGEITRGLVIIPCTRRPTPKRIREDLTRFALVPDVDPVDYTDTCVPRYAGLWAIVDELRAMGLIKKSRWIDMTQGTSRPAWTLLMTPNIVFGTLFRKIRERTDEMRAWRSAQDVRVTLNTTWPEKNKQLLQWRSR